jgi:histone deacetylase 11
MVLDLDAHQGNGHALDFMHDDATCIVDFYNDCIYPGDVLAKHGIARAVPVRARCTDARYMSLLRKHLVEMLDAFKPEFLVYNAGTDCLKHDPLGNLNLSAQCIADRDEFVFRTCLERKVPLLMVLSGGYQACNADVIVASLVNLNDKLHLFSSPSSSSSRDDHKEAEDEEENNEAKAKTQ